MALTTQAFGQAGTWDTTRPDLPAGTERWLHAAATIGSTVYVFGGGRSAVPSLMTVDALGPGALSWVSMPPMGVARRAHGIGVVNGLAYAIGGLGGNNLLQSVEVFDPTFGSTGGWALLSSPMPTARAHLGVGVINRKIYVVGGLASGAIRLNTLECYDPLSSTWTTLLPMPTARMSAAVGVIGGKLYVAGGDTGNANATDVLECYDPQTDTWTTGLAVMPTARFEVTGAVVQGRLFVIGGCDQGCATNLKVVEAYDPVSNTWSTLSAMPSARSRLAATSRNGEIVVVGGFAHGMQLTTVETFTPPPTVTWTQLAPTGPLPPPRDSHAAAYDPTSNRLIVFGGGGVFNAGPFLNDTWVLTNANGVGGTPSWIELTTAGGPPPDRFEHTSVYDVACNRLIVFGGVSGNLWTEVNDVWVLSNANGTGAGTPTWTQLTPTGSAPSPRSGAAAIYDAATNSMVVFGGNPARGNCNVGLSDLWRLDHANGLGGPPSWTQLTATGAPPPGREGHSAVYDPATGRMTVFGGQSPCAPYYNDAWVLANATGLAGTPSWTQLAPTGALPATRFVHAAVLDPATGDMTVFGGATPGPVSDLWTLSHASGLGGVPAWAQNTPAGVTPSARFGHSAARDPATGAMIVFGGHDPLTSADPITVGELNEVWVLSAPAPPNQPPIANDDAAITAQNTPVTIGVLNNDSDPDLDPISVVAICQCASGYATVNPDNTVTYAPAPTFVGVDTFTYTVSDGKGGTSIATVTVTVTSVNHVPVAGNDVAITAEDTPVTTGNVLANDTDADGNSLTIAAFDAISVNGGTVAAAGVNAFTYTPSLNYNGPDSFTYTVSDGNGGTAVGMVAVTVTPVNGTPPFPIGGGTTFQMTVNPDGSMTFTGPSGRFAFMVPAGTLPKLGKTVTTKIKDTPKKIKFQIKNLLLPAGTTKSMTLPRFAYPDPRGEWLYLRDEGKKDWLKTGLQKKPKPGNPGRARVHLVGPSGSALVDLFDGNPLRQVTWTPTSVTVSGLLHSGLVFTPQLASFDLTKAEVESNKGRIKLRAKLTLPPGVTRFDLAPTAELIATIGGTNGVTVSGSVALTAHGNKWELRSNSATAGIDEVKLNWEGGKFRYDGRIGIQLGHQGEHSTSLELDAKQETDFTIEVAGRQILVGPSGVTGPADVETDYDDEDREIEVEFQEALTLDSTITIRWPDGSSITVLLRDHYTPTTAKLEVKLRLPTGTSIDPSVLAHSLDVDFGIGDEPYAGDYTVNPTDWKNVTPKEWKFKKQD